jgi:hypothetical protein
MGAPPTTSGFVWLLLILAAAVLGLGLYLARAGLRPRRRGDSPHCRKCDYILSGLETPRCPECGADLSAAGAIVYGERHVRRGRAGIGLALVVIGLAAVVLALTPGFRQINWYQYKPAAWVIKDLKSSDLNQAAVAWKELSRRMDEGGLSAGQRSAMADAILDRFSKDVSRISWEPVSHVVRQAKELSPEQKERLFSALLAAVQLPPPQAYGARDALDRLLSDGVLTEAQHGRLTELALAEQAQAAARSPVAQWLLNYLGDRELAGRLTPQQRARFYTNAYNVSDMVVRKQVVNGDLAAYTISIGGRGPEIPYSGKNSIWWTRHKIDRIVLNGKTVQTGGGSSSSSGFARGTTGSWVQTRTPGKHRLEVALTLEVHFSPSVADEAKDGLRWKKQVTLGGDFDVLAEAPPGFVQWVDDTSKEAIKRSITPERLDRTYNGGKGLNVQFKIDKVPENVGFEVFGVVGGKEHLLGTLTAAAGTETHSSFSASSFPATPDGKIDLILRSDEKAVRQTVDIYKAWKGELVYKDVPVASERK